MNQETEIRINWQNQFKLIFQWLFNWARISILGWFKLLIDFIRFFSSITTALSWQTHIFILTSFLIAVIPIFPWFQYTLTLGQTESYQMTTNLWYLFFIPGVCGLVFAFFPIKKAYQIQIGLSGFILLFFIYSYFFPEKTHYNILDKVSILPSYYVYVAVLIAQLTVTFVLKTPKNSILIQIKQKWAKMTN